MNIKKIIAGILTLATVATAIAWPTVTSDAVETKAAPGYIESIGNTHYTYSASGEQIYKIWVENGVLYIRGEYFSNSSALLSYHTKWLYFTKEPTGGYPKKNAPSVPYVRVNVSYIRDTPSEREGYIYSTFAVKGQDLKKKSLILYMAKAH